MFPPSSSTSDPAPASDDWCGGLKIVEVVSLNETASESTDTEVKKKKTKEKPEKSKEKTKKDDKVTKKEDKAKKTTDRKKLEKKWKRMCKPCSVRAVYRLSFNV